MADTLLTIAVNTDYVVTNAAITLNYYSHQASPIGYPGNFNYVPTYTGSGSLTYGTVTGVARFAITGGVCFVNLAVTGTVAGAGTDIIFSLPIAASNLSAGDFGGACYGNDSGDIICATYSASSTQIGVIKLAGNWNAASGKIIRGMFHYTI